MTTSPFFRKWSVAFLQTGSSDVGQSWSISILIQYLPIHIPSGKHTKNYGKSQFFMGKSTISMAIFNSYVSHYQRVWHHVHSLMEAGAGLKVWPPTCCNESRRLVSWLVNQKHGFIRSFKESLPFARIIELDDGKIYRKALFLMVKTMVSCRFSLKPIQWQNVSPEEFYLARSHIYSLPRKLGRTLCCHMPQWSWMVCTGMRLACDVRAGGCLGYMPISFHLASLRCSLGVSMLSGF